MNRKIWLRSVCLVVLCGYASAEHRSLLPRPQQVEYGRDRVPLCAMQIVFAGTPNAADRFAAEQLQTWLQEESGQAVTIASYGNQDQVKLAVVLEREGMADIELAQPGEMSGPRSREAYDLSVSAREIRIHARSSAGLYYGAQTLRQMVEGRGGEAALPEVTVHDWPSMVYRGTMIDISHGPLLTEREIERELDFLARWKTNQYYLYTENSIELKGYPLMNLGARLSQEEVRRIVAYGRQRHIDVIPNFDLYGHQHDLFRIESYADLADGAHGSEFDPSNSKATALMQDWINQFADLFPSPFVNIGFDETFQIEAATHASGAAAEPAALFIRQLSMVSEMFARRGKRVMAYDDIMVKYPPVISQLPSGIIAVAWYYTSEDPGYHRWLDPLVAHKIPHMIQPGVMSYDDIAVDFATTFENIDTFLAAGRKSSALGLVNSVWSDDAQILLRMSLPGMAYGAVAPWQSTPMARDRFYADYAEQMYPSAVAPSLAAALGEMEQAQTSINKVLGGNSIKGLWEDPFFPVFYKKLEGHRQNLRETRLHAEKAQEKLLHALELGGDSETVDSLLIGSELLDYAGQRFQVSLDMTAIWNKFGTTKPDGGRWWNEWGSQVTYFDHSYLADLMDRITGLKPRYQQEWEKQYTSYRMGTALGRWDAEYQFWLGVHNKLQHFDQATKPGDPLPPLNEVIESPNPSWWH